MLGLGSVALGLFWSEKKSEATTVCQANREDSSQLELKLVQVLFRHGARTPLKSIPDVLEVRTAIISLSMMKWLLDNVWLTSCVMCHAPTDRFMSQSASLYCDYRMSGFPIGAMGA